MSVRARPLLTSRHIYVCVYINIYNKARESTKQYASAQVGHSHLEDIDVGNEVEGQGVRKNLILVAIELLGAARHLLTTGEGVKKKKKKFRSWPSCVMQKRRHLMLAHTSRSSACFKDAFQQV